MKYSELREQFYSGQLDASSDFRVNALDKEHKSLFYLACEEGDLNLVKYFLQFEDLEPNAADYLGKTPFYIACEKGHEKVVKHLLKNDAIAVNQADDKGLDPFFVAFEAKDCKIMLLLLKSNRYDIHLSFKGDEDEDAGTVPTFSDLCALAKLTKNSQKVQLAIDPQDAEELAILYCAFPFFASWSKKPFNQLSNPIDDSKVNAVFKKYNYNESDSILFKNVFANDPVALQKFLKNLEKQTVLLRAASVFSLINLYTLDYLRPSSLDTNNISRFLAIAQRIPIELQMLLLLRLTGSTSDFINSTYTLTATKALCHAFSKDTDDKMQTVFKTVFKNHPPVPSKQAQALVPSN